MKRWVWNLEMLEADAEAMGWSVVERFGRMSFEYPLVDAVVVLYGLAGINYVNRLNPDTMKMPAVHEGARLIEIDEALDCLRHPREASFRAELAAMTMELRAAGDGLLDDEM